MIISEKTIGKITVIVLADKKSNYYLSESNDIKIIDEDFMLNQISLLKSAKKKNRHLYNKDAVYK